MASLLPTELNERLRTALSGVPPTNPGLASASERTVVRLTPSDARVLRALTEAGGLGGVADRLFISRNTLKTHLRALYGKLGVSSRAEAVALGRQLGLLTIDEGPPPGR